MRCLARRTSSLLSAKIERRTRSGAIAAPGRAFIVGIAAVYDRRARTILRQAIFRRGARTTRVRTRRVTTDAVDAESAAALIVVRARRPIRFASLASAAFGVLGHADGRRSIGPALEYGARAIGVDIASNPRQRPRRDSRIRESRREIAGKDSIAEVERAAAKHRAAVVGGQRNGRHGDTGRVLLLPKDVTVWIEFDQAQIDAHGGHDTGTGVDGPGKTEREEQIAL